MRMSILLPLDADTNARVDEAVRKKTKSTGLRATRTDVARLALREYLERLLGPAAPETQTQTPAAPKKTAPKKPAPSQDEPPFDVDALPNPFMTP